MILCGEKKNHFIVNFPWYEERFARANWLVTGIQGIPIGGKADSDQLAFFLFTEGRIRSNVLYI